MKTEGEYVDEDRMTDRLLDDEEQDDCMPTEAELLAYLAEPDDEVAESLSPADKKLVAKVILHGRKILITQDIKTLKAVQSILDQYGYKLDFEKGTLLNEK